MIRTSTEAALLCLWRDVNVLRRLGRVESLTTARFEPVSRNALGSGYVDLLFESDGESCVMGGLRLDPNSLITRERSPFIWPAYLATWLDSERLRSIETFLTPWLRSIARGRPMAQESIRRFATSQRFDRARAAELLGAVPLHLVMKRMAPFVYGRRFAGGRRVSIDCGDEALAHAVLSDVAQSIGYSREATDDPDGDRAFARAWYGLAVRNVMPAAGIDTDLAFVDTRGNVAARIIIETKFSGHPSSAAIDVPSPAPLDLLFSFDAADAPVVSRFSVSACEPALRICEQLNYPKVMGGSAGSIVLALSAEARATRGADVEEAETLKASLIGEGFIANIVTDVGDPLLARADLVHVFGGAFEAHTVAFGQAASQRGIDFVFDVPPRSQSPSGQVEDVLLLALRAASDDAETSQYLQAYEAGRAAAMIVVEPSPEQYAQVEARFAELATKSLAVLTAEEDVAGLRASLSPAAAPRILARGVIASSESAPASIGYLVPSAPFAFVHAPIGSRSHALFAAFAAERCGVPLVICGPCNDVDYLQTLRTIAPSAVVLADPAAGVVAAIYRCATIWVDAAPRPRSAAGLVRAVACGALPVLAAESPLALIAGTDALTFPLTSFAECAATLLKAMTLADREVRIAALQARLAPMRDLERTFAALMVAYSRVTAAAPT